MDHANEAELTLTGVDNELDSLKGCKKAKALTVPVAQLAVDLCSTSCTNTDDVDFARLLKHNAIPAGSRGSFSHSFIEVGELGRGEFGKVVHVRAPLDLGEYAIKMTAAGRHLGNADVRRLLLEAQVMRLLGERCTSASMLRLHGAWIESMEFKQELLFRFYLRLELAGASLAALSRTGERFDESRLVSILNQVASVLADLHAIGFAHLDVKPDNLLLARHAPGVVKLGDFGLAARLDGRVDVEDGDRRYIAPEVLRGDYGRLAAADVFSLGASLVELATGTALPDDGALYSDLRAGRLPHLPGIGRAFQEVLAKMMSPRPEDRPDTSVLAAWTPERSVLLGASLPSTLSKLQVGSSSGGSGDARVADTDENNKWKGTVTQLFKGRATAAVPGKPNKRKSGETKKKVMALTNKQQTLEFTSAIPQRGEDNRVPHL